MLRVLVIMLLSGLLASCSYTTQATSGSDYLQRYAEGPYSGTSTENGEKLSLDEQVRQIASVEPNLVFPARIGLARLERGRLSTIPNDELVIWSDLTQRLGNQYGDFVPVNPMIAAMVRPEDASNRRYGPEEAMADIRRGAARQHLDYVLVYELSGEWNRSANILSIGDLTILGMFLLPSREMEVRGVANGLLIDVRNGYPYGTVSAFVEDEFLTRSANLRNRGNDEVTAAKIEAVGKLTADVEAMMNSLYSQFMPSNETEVSQ